MIPPIYKNIIKVIIAISFILILVIIFFEAGSAKVNINIKSQERIMNFATAVTESGANNTLPGRILQTEIEKSNKFTTPASEITATQASGLVTIINNHTTSQPLVITTRLLTAAGLLFRLQSSVNIPAGGKVEVLAKADQTGDQYLIGPTKFTIPGLNESLQQKIYAESYGPMTYAKSTKKQITQEVYNQAKDELINLIKDEALTTFQSQITETETIKEDALAIEILEEKSNAKIGDEKNDFEITLKTKVKTLAFNENDLRQKVIEGLQASLASGDQAEYNNPQMVLNIELYPKEPSNIAVITGQYQIKVINKVIDLNIIKGLSKPEAENELKNLDNVESAEVKLFPFWVTKVPSDDNKIKVIIK